MWDAETGREMRTLAGHASPVQSVCVSPDGRQVFAWDEIGKVLAWELETGHAIDPVDPPPRPGSGNVFTPDGRYKIVALGDTVGIVDLQRIRWPLPDAENRAWYHDQQAAEAAKETDQLRREPPSTARGPRPLGPRPGVRRLPDRLLAPRDRRDSSRHPVSP